jgi:hypothetical protein
VLTRHEPRWMTMVPLERTEAIAHDAMNFSIKVLLQCITLQCIKFSMHALNAFAQGGLECLHGDALVTYLH